jgi:hypothetical protein
MLEPGDELEEPTAAEIATTAELLDAIDEFDVDGEGSLLKRRVGTLADAEDAYASN